jgi:hypothetical protein
LASLVVALGALPLYSIVRRRFGSSLWALGFALAYLLLPAVETAVGWDVHGTSFVPPLLLASLDAAERDRRGWWWAWALLAMGAREDLPFLVGWAMFWMVPRRHRREGAVMLALGTSLSLLYFFVVIPYFGGGEGTPYLTRFLPPGYAPTLAGALDAARTGAFWRASLVHFVTYNVRLGLPLLFLFWLHPPSVLAMAPFLLLNGLSWYEPARFPELWHYSLPIIPWALVGTTEGFLRLERVLLRWKPDFRWRNVLGEALAVSVVGSHLVAGFTPLSLGFTWPQPSGREAAVQAVLAHIPQDAAVSADMTLAPHLAQRPTLRLFPDTRDAEWVVVDLWFGGDPYGSKEAIWQGLVVDQSWETVEAREGLVLLRTGAGPPEGVEDALRDFALELPPLDVGFGEGEEEIALTGLGVYRKPLGLTYLCTRWRREWSSLTVPQVALVEAEGETEARSLDGWGLVPQVFAKPGSFIDCTDLLVGRYTSEPTVRLFVEGEEGRKLPITEFDTFALEGEIERKGEALLLRLSEETRLPHGE